MSIALNTGLTMASLVEVVESLREGESKTITIPETRLDEVLATLDEHPVRVEWYEHFYDADLLKVVIEYHK